MKPYPKHYKNVFHIYIPHWLDSMSLTLTFFDYIYLIYIPHWLDSMVRVGDYISVYKKFTFHTG